MVQFKELIKVIVVFITINNCACKAQSDISNKCNNTDFVFSDTLVLKSDDYIVNKYKGGFNLVITNIDKLNKVKIIKSPIIKFCNNNQIKKAKGNEIINSGIPVDCDYFYPIEKDSTIFIITKKVISFIEIDKVIK